MWKKDDYDHISTMKVCKSIKNYTVKEEASQL